ncbi:MAG: hypothetical protein ABSH19_03605 [Opitutales bacterium]|jgi:hypothetical protein
MKSAYELAMERLKAADPGSGHALTPGQKKQLAEIDTRYQAKLAEREIFLRQQLAAVAADPAKADEAEKIREQIRRERQVLEEDREDEKNRIRQAARA